MASHRVAQARDRNCHQQYQAVRDTLGLEISVGVYDGDTKSEEKSRIRDECNVVITSFVGLNQYLESHHLWVDFHSNCSLAAIDEASYNDEIESNNPDTWGVGDTIQFEIKVGGADFREPPVGSNPDADELTVLKVTTLTGVESLAVLDVHITARWKHDTKTGPQVVRRNADDLQSVAADNGFQDWHTEYEIAAYDVEYLVHYRGSSAKAAATNALN